MEEIPNNHLGRLKTPVNNGINYQRQLLRKISEPSTECINWPQASSSYDFLGLSNLKHMRFAFEIRSVRIIESSPRENKKKHGRHWTTQQIQETQQQKIWWNFAFSWGWRVGGIPNLTPIHWLPLAAHPTWTTVFPPRWTHHSSRARRRFSVCKTTGWWVKQQSFRCIHFPICSMYGMLTHTYHGFMVHVGKYSIHGVSGFWSKHGTSTMRGLCFCSWT